MTKSKLLVLILIVILLLSSVIKWEYAWLIFIGIILTLIEYYIRRPKREVAEKPENEY